MAVNELEDVLHKIDVRLYPSHFSNVEEPYVARVEDERVLFIEAICASLLKRGGFTGNYEDAVSNIKQFCEECAFLLLDGYGLNMKYYSIHPRVGGGWHNPDEGFDREKHPVGFSFRIRNPLRKLADEIKLNVLGVADKQGAIYEFIDEDNGNVNETCTTGRILTIRGYGLKVAGDAAHASVVGVFFDGQQSDVTMDNHVVAVNEQATLKVLVPNMSTPNTVKIRVVTQSQLSGHGELMKDIREITSNFVLDVQ
jgi:hypothetical protein